jgi:hypothetical protein
MTDEQLELKKSRTTLKHTWIGTRRFSRAAVLWETLQYNLVSEPVGKQSKGQRLAAQRGG